MAEYRWDVAPTVLFFFRHIVIVDRNPTSGQAASRLNASADNGRLHWSASTTKFTAGKKKKKKKRTGCDFVIDQGFCTVSACPLFLFCNSCNNSSILFDLLFSLTYFHYIHDFLFFLFLLHVCLLVAPVGCHMPVVRRPWEQMDRAGL